MNHTFLNGKRLPETVLENYGRLSEKIRLTFKSPSIYNVSLGINSQTVACETFSGWVSLIGVPGKGGE